MLCNVCMYIYIYGGPPLSKPMNISLKMSEATVKLGVKSACELKKTQDFRGALVKIRDFA